MTHHRSPVAVLNNISKVLRYLQTPELERGHCAGEPSELSRHSPCAWRVPNMAPTNGDLPSRGSAAKHQMVDSQWLIGSLMIVGDNQ